MPVTVLGRAGRIFAETSEPARNLSLTDVPLTKATPHALHALQGNMQDVQARSRLLPLLRSPLIGELLAWLFLHPEEQYSVTELAHRLGSSQSTVSREVDRLSGSELVHEERRGNLRLLRANLDNALARPLGELLALTYGPAAVLGELLCAVDGVEEAFVYGSWAARYAGEQGPPPRDIDVLIVGTADEDDLADAARVAERRLGREVNAHQVSARAWQSGSDPFLTSVRARPLYPIDVSGGDR